MQLITFTTLMICAVALSEATLDNNMNASTIDDLSTNVTKFSGNSSTANTSSVPTIQLADNSREE